MYYAKDTDISLRIWTYVDLSIYIYIYWHNKGFYYLSASTCLWGTFFSWWRRRRRRWQCDDDDDDDDITESTHVEMHSVTLHCKCTWFGHVVIVSTLLTRYKIFVIVCGAGRGTVINLRLHAKLRLLAILFAVLWEWLTTRWCDDVAGLTSGYKNVGFRTMQKTSRRKSLNWSFKYVILLNILRGAFTF